MLVTNAPPSLVYPRPIVHLLSVLASVDSPRHGCDLMLGVHLSHRWTVQGAGIFASLKCHSHRVL